MRRSVAAGRIFMGVSADVRYQVREIGGGGGMCIEALEALVSVGSW